MKKNYVNLFTSLLLFAIFNSTLYAQKVNNNNELQTAITNATPGSTIILADGTWDDAYININKTGTSTNPITIEAETPGSVFFEGNSQVRLGGSYIIFEGVVFQNSSNLQDDGEDVEPIIELRDENRNECDNCTITNIKIDSYNGTSAQETFTFKWIIVYGQYNEISYSSFIGKYGIGSIINDNRNATSIEFAEPDFTRIHHNYFADRTPVGIVNALNDQDAIRIGNSSTSLHPSNTEVYDNLFYNWSGEVEIISNKSGENKYYNNTFRDYQGTLTLRHGDDCEVYNNFFFANNNQFSGGVRVIGEGHKIYNNYIEGVNSEKPDGGNTKTAGAINVSNGQENSPLNRYFQVKDVTIVNNTFVNCDYGFRVGTSVSNNPVLTLAPENLIIANNIMINTDDNAVDEQTAPIGTSIYEGNITQNGSWDLTTGTNNNQEVTDGLLESNSLFYTLGSSSPAIDAAIGNYSFLTNDILGGNRPLAYDAGAEEFNSGGSRIPYTTSDVGITIGFGGTGIDTPRLSTNPTSINVSRSAGSTTFSINANVDWTISNNANWLSLNTTSGSNSAAINANFTENNSGASRTAIVTINEVTGGNNLTTTFTITQSNFFAEEITIVGATAIGTEAGKANVAPIFAWDDNVTAAEYWSGDASAESEVSITFDLSCIHVLSQIGMHILKADERTINFDIAVADDSNGPFTDVFTGQESTIVAGGVNEEQRFNLTNVTGRYLKFTSNGNSEGSGFASISEVSIYGNTQCDAILGVEENTLASKGITMYPIPAKNEAITIESNNRIGTVEVYDLSGRAIVQKQINNISGQLETNNLSTGTYIVKIQEVFGRFIIQ